MSDDDPFAPCDRDGCGHRWSEHTYGEGCDLCVCDAHVMTFARLVPHSRPDGRERFYRAVDSVLDRISR